MSYTPVPSSEGNTLALTLVADLENPVVGDLHFHEGTFAFWGGSTAAVQKVTTRSRFFQGEWFLDVNEGVPFYGEILGKKNPNKSKLIGIFRDMLLSIPNVAAVKAIDLVIGADRAAVVPYTVSLTDGTVLSAEFAPLYFPRALP